MTKAQLKYFILTLYIVTMCACSATRRVPNGSYLLTKNSVVVDKERPNSERIKSNKVERFIKPQPNRKFLGTNLYLALHNAASADTTRKGWINRTLRKMGDPPVLLDTVLVKQSAGIISNYIAYVGFYNNEVEYSIDTTRRRKRAQVKYTIKQRAPYRIGEIQYEFKDEFLRPIVMQDSARTLLHTGDILDGDVLNAEKVRITEYLKDRGYYDFSLNNIEFIGDSTAGNHVTNMKVVFKQHLAGYDSKGVPMYENNSIYRIGSIVVNPDFDPMMSATNPDYYLNMDTVEYRGLNIIKPTDAKQRVRSKVLRKSINIYPNSLYSSTDVQQAYNNIMRLGFYKNASIIFEKVESSDSLGSNEVVFIGGDDDGGDVRTTTEEYMVCHINGIPALKQSYKIELEGTTSSNFYAISATLGYQNRNLFRGVELFDVSVKGGYEFARVKGWDGSFEIGGAVSMSFPRFITPFNVDPLGKRVNPRTKVEMSINTQKRPYYRRTISGMTWAYSWSNGRKSSFVLRPIDLNLVKVGSLNEDWMNSLENEYLKNSYRSQLVAGISGQFIYNQQAGNVRLDGSKHMVIRFNWETAGNLFYGLSNLFDARQKLNSNGRWEYQAFGIGYAQYFRIDASLSNKIILAPKVNIAYRFYLGGGLSYGNASSIPFDRLFYSGGSNSMRGWITRTLGPGGAKQAGNSRYPNQLGNMKLEANAELRFPMVGILNGALFFDVGNIWFIKEGTSADPMAAFRLNRFYRQLGFNTGLGFRVDIGVAVIRFDWGIRIHDPNLDKGSRWIERFKFSNTVLNFGVGYPF